MHSKKELELLIISALEKLIDKDRELLINDVNERTLTHRFSIYLEEHINSWKEDWNIDCEYNRDASIEIPDYPKKLHLIDIPQNHIRIDDEEATTIFPDIIIHKRGQTGKQMGNLLVIEMKKSTSSKERIEYDKNRKLPSYMTELKYQFALLIVLETKGKAFYHLEWIQ
jgi:hypothetical protein